MRSITAWSQVRILLVPLELGKNKTMYYVYVIESQRNFDLYKGFTKDVSKRLKEHNAGVTYATKEGGPWN